MSLLQYEVLDYSDQERMIASWFKQFVKMMLRSFYTVMRAGCLERETWLFGMLGHFSGRFISYLVLQLFACFWGTLRGFEVVSESLAVLWFTSYQRKCSFAVSSEVSRLKTRLEIVI